MILAVDIGVLEFLHSLADTADTLAGDAWLSGSVPVSAKPDGSPVTATDLAVESALRDLVRQRYPADGFLGEEVGRTVGVSDRNWVVDGIDGTAAFVAGRREWSTLISIVDRHRVVAGIASGPALGKRWSGMLGSGAEVISHEGRRRRVEVSSRSKLDGSRISSWPPADLVPDRFRPSADCLARLSTPPTQRPSWGAKVPNGAMLVAEGRIDAFVLFGGEVWDHAACSAIVIAAGGRWSDIDGDEGVKGGPGVYTNGHIHDAVLATLRGDS